MPTPQMSIALQSDDKVAALICEFICQGVTLVKPMS